MNHGSEEHSCAQAPEWSTQVYVCVHTCLYVCKYQIHQTYICCLLLRGMCVWSGEGRGKLSGLQDKWGGVPGKHHMGERATGPRRLSMARSLPPRLGCVAG